MKREQGFTLVEVIIAILVLTVGLLGLVTSAALVTRMIGRGQHSAVAAQYAQRRLEMLRVTGCKSQTSGSEVWTRGERRSIPSLGTSRNGTCPTRRPST